MALNVISNYAANVAHRYLVKADAAASSSLAKLSAGSRVISAKDDAASLAIGSRLNAEVQAQKQAQVNAIQASSMLQIADGAMAKVNDILVRMKTLAVQAGSGQLGSTERGMLNTEYQSLLLEVDRIADVTKFNGVTLVDGSTTTATNRNALSAASNNLIQAADGFSSVTLGNSVGNATMTVAYSSTSHVLTLTNQTTGESQGIDLGSAAITGNNIQTVNFDTLDTVVVLNAAFDKTASIAPTDTYTLGAGGPGATSGAIDLTTVRVSGTNAASLTSPNVTIARAATMASAVITAGGYTGSANLSSTGAKTVTMASGTDTFTLAFTVSTAFASSAGAAVDTLALGTLGATVFGGSNTSNTTSFTFKLGTGATAGVDDVTISVNAVSSGALSINGTLISGATGANADAASTAITTAIDTLNTSRATVGAAQNRLEFASDNLATTIENTEAARSSLLDLDVAQEMTMFTSKQILVQSGVSMLAQANQMPQSLLKLFQ
jgi:flagellin